MPPPGRITSVTVEAF